MKYEIVPKADTVLVTVTDGPLSEELDMCQEPPSGSMLVQQGRTDVLGQINLEKMLSNLNNCVDLLQITFNAVDGFAVQSQVQELSNQFIDAMNSSNKAALDFQLSAHNALESCIYAYTMLMEGDVEPALELLAGTRNAAKEMVRVSDGLVGTYQGLTDYTNAVLKSVMDERALDESKREQTKTMIGELEGSMQAMEALKESLSADIKQMDAEYKELQVRELREEKRAFGMQLASLVVGSLGSIVGIPFQVLASSKDDRDAAEQDSPEGVSSQDQAEREYAENVGRQTAIGSELKKIDARIQRIDEVLDGELYQGGANNAQASPDDPDAQKTDGELRQEKQDKMDEKAALNQELAGLKGKESALQDTLKKLGAATEKISERTRAAAEEMQGRADRLAERIEEIGRKREELRALERKNLMDLAKNTAKMKNMVMDANALESAIQCLVIATGCLRKVLAYLQEVKLFWMNVEAFCGNLANDGNLSALISRKKDHPAEECAASFKGQIFVRGYLGLMAKWQALCVIFGEYHTALAQVAKRMGKALEQPLSTERKVQWELASQMAGELNRKLKEEAAGF